MDFPYKNWMHNLPSSIKDIPIIYLGIPGSHDTMTYGIDKHSKASPDANKTIKILSRLFPRIVRRWSITQSLNITDQLNHGIRYFDLRICIKNLTKFYFAHGLYAMEIFEPLRDIKIFLDENKNEFVILDFQHFYNFTDKQHSQLQYHIYKIFGNKCYGRNDGALSECTLNKCTNSGKQVIVIYRRYPHILIEFWPQEYWPTPWPNTTNVKILKKILYNNLEKRCPQTGYVSQCILTPSVSYITARSCSSLKRMATQTNRNMKFWISNQHCGKFDQNDQPTANVFIADFISSDPDFCGIVIGLNKIAVTTQNDCYCSSE